MQAEGRALMTMTVMVPRCSQRQRVCFEVDGVDGA